MVGSSTELLGTRIANIRLLDVLGTGGMGTVFVGFDERLERQVAVKAIRPEFRLRPGVKARFLREARILSQLKHPRVCTVHDYLEGEEHDFLVLELVEGQNLRQLLQRGLDFDQKSALATQLLEVLTEVHGHGVVHRDLKPENVMVEPSGEIKVLDFGLARSLEDEAEAPQPGTPPATAPPESADERQTAAFGASLASADSSSFEHTAVAGGSEASLALRTRVGTILGTVGYMSPEQARGEPATPASDIYSLGLLLQEMFTERPVMEEGLSPMDRLLKAAAGDTLPAVGLAAELTTLIERMKSYASGARPSAPDALTMLQHFIDGPQRRRRRRLVAAVWAALLALTAGTTVQSLRASRAAAEADAQRRLAVAARDRAEGLMSFMLIDLAGSLKPLGKLPLLDQVARTALDYFQSLPAEEMTDSARRQRSLALRQVGQVLQEQGDLDQALAAYREGRAMAAELAQEQASELNDLELKDSLDHLGMALFGQGNLEGAREAFAEAAGVTEGLLATRPDDAELLDEHSFSLNALGIVHSHLGDLAHSEEYYTRALEIRSVLAEKAGPADPIQMALGTTLLNLGVLQADRGNLMEAIDSYDHALHILQAMARQDPEHALARKQLALVNNNRAVALSTMGDHPGALAGHRAALQVMEELVALDPSNATWQRDRARSLANIAATLVDLRRTEDALPDQRRAIRIYRELVTRDPSNSTWNSDVGTSLVALAQMQRELGHRQDALHDFERARLECEQILTRFPDEPLNQRNLGDALEGLAMLHLELGQTDRALVASRRGLEIRTELAAADPEHASWRADRARSLALLARVRMLTGNAAAARQLFTQAVHILEALLAQEPQHVLWRKSLAETLLGLGEDLRELELPAEAEVQWRRALELAEGENGAAVELPEVALQARLLLRQTEGVDRLIARLGGPEALSPTVRELCRETGFDLR